MADLRVVGTDADHLLLVDDNGGGHRVALDDRLHGALQRAAHAGESRLSPREIQERLRAGASVEQIATAAGVSVERIRRWEGPVLAERAYALQRALATRYSRPPDGSVSGPLGRLVTARLDSSGAFYKLDLANAACSFIASGSYPNSLSFIPKGTLDPNAEALGLREPPRVLEGGLDKGSDRGLEKSRAESRRVPRRVVLPSWESIVEGAPPPSAFPT